MRTTAKACLPLAAALALGAGFAHADERQRTKSAGEQRGGEAPKEITGRVLQAGPSKLFLEHMGAVVEFNIAPDARFSGGNVRSFRDISEGQDVRASFTVENKTTNVAKEISVTSGAGATGSKQGAPERGPIAPGERSPSDQGNRTPTPEPPATTPPSRP